MRKKLLLLAFCFFTSWALQAQSEAEWVKSLSDSISNLYERYFKLSQTNDSLRRNVSTTINGLEDKVKVLENQAQGNTEQLQRITTQDRRSLQNIYEKNKLSVVATANFMDAVNSGLNALEFSVSSLDYSNSIFELNNPTNTDLGFSLDKVILRIVDDKIIKGKFEKKFGSKLRNVISSVINNPIVNNPITKAVFSTVPAVSSISSVYNMINTLAVQEEDVNVEALNAFNKELQKYVAHYEALAKASKDLDFNLSNLKVKAESVRKVASNFVRESVSDLYETQELPANLSTLEMNAIINQYYTYARTSEYILALERKNNMNYAELSRRLVFPVVGRSKVSFIAEEMEKLYSEYITTLNTYHQSVIMILNNATGLSDDVSKVSQKINDLNQRYERLLATYEKNVDLNKIKALEDSIPRF